MKKIKISSFNRKLAGFVIVILAMACSQKRDTRIELDRLDKIEPQISKLLNWEKENGKNHDSIIFDLVLGESKIITRKKINKLLYNEVLIKKTEGYGYKLKLKTLPIIELTPYFSQGKLYSIILQYSSINHTNPSEQLWKINSRFQKILTKKYSNYDIHYRNTDYYDELDINYWIKGDLIITKKSNSNYLTITYVKWTIKHRKDIIQHKIKYSNYLKKTKLLESKKLKQKKEEDSINQIF